MRVRIPLNDDGTARDAILQTWAFDKALGKRGIVSLLGHTAPNCHTTDRPY